MDDRPQEQDLAAIRRLMEDAQAGVPEAGKHFIVWGAVIAVGALCQYASLRGVPLPGAAVWAASLASGWALSLWVGWRDQARAPVQTLLARVVAGIWIGCGVSATVITLVGYYAGAIRPAALPGSVALVIAAGSFASGIAYRSTWMRLGAVGWWLGAAAMLLWPGAHTLLVMAALSVGLQVVPGVLFYRRARTAGATPDG